MGTLRTMSMADKKKDEKHIDWLIMKNKQLLYSKVSLKREAAHLSSVIASQGQGPKPPPLLLKIEDFRKVKNEDIIKVGV
mmetsp:Transcript_30237/g.46232  ORF Transcript_30237/g.46232 Transcript_30237/m.46232 type:complete len:80 (+) Transcript_30237:73-312(+)